MVVVMVLGGGLPRTPAFTAGNPTAFSSPLAHAPILCQNNRTANLLKIFRSLRCPKKQYKEPTKSWQPHQGQFHNRPVTQSRCGRYLAFERFMELLYTNQARDREAAAAACASAVYGFITRPCGKVAGQSWRLSVESRAMPCRQHQQVSLSLAPPSPSTPRRCRWSVSLHCRLG